MVFQQLGQLVRWSWGYHVLLAPPESYELREENEAIEEGRYRDDPIEQLILGLDGGDEGEERYQGYGQKSDAGASSASLESGGQDTNHQCADTCSSGSDSDEEQVELGKAPVNWRHNNSNASKRPIEWQSHLIPNHQIAKSAGGTGYTRRHQRLYTYGSIKD